MGLRAATTISPRSLVQRVRIMSFAGMRMCGGFAAGANYENDSVV
jgi:hypothetical protein